MSAATVAAIAKAAVAVLSNEKTRKALGWVIVAILSPLIVLVVLICAVLSGSSQHNVSAVELCFHGGTISSSATPEYRGYIENMRGSFAQLDRAIEEINAQCEDGNSLDDTRVKAVFYALYFAAEHPDDSGIRAFTDCFVDYEERTRTVTTTDEEGNEVEVEETYTVAIPVTDMNEVYARIEAAMGITVTPENQSTRWLTSLMPRKRVRSWTRWASTAEKNTGNLCWSLRQRWNRRSQRWKRRRCDRPDNALLARCAPLWGVLPPSWHPYPSTGLKRRVRALCRCADRDSSQP